MMRSRPHHDSKKKIRYKQRSGVSPVIATTIILGITVALGLGLWSFANTSVSSATKDYAETVTEYGRFTSDRFLVANMDFHNPSAGRVAFWIYNSGELPTTVSNVILTCTDCSPAFSPTATPDIKQTNPSDPLTIESKAVKKFWWDTETTIEGGRHYELTVISETGALHSFIKRSD
jgi:hypothetical protein